MTMFHMMTALVISAAMIYFATECGQSPKKVEVEPIKGYRQNMYMHSYYQIDPESINKTSGVASAENNASIEILEHDMELSLYFESTFHSAMDIIFPKPQIKCPEGLITEFIMIPTTWILISSQLIIACGHIMIQKPKTKRKRRRKISEEAAARRKPDNTS